MIADMGYTSRKVPNMQGWCANDGADMIPYEIDLPGTGYDMTESEYVEWWNRFRGSGFDAERIAFFNSSRYEAVGNHSAPFMAADDVYTSS